MHDIKNSRRYWIFYLLSIGLFLYVKIIAIHITHWNLLAHLTSILLLWSELGLYGWKKRVRFFRWSVEVYITRWWEIKQSIIVFYDYIRHVYYLLTYWHIFNSLLIPTDYFHLTCIPSIIDIVIYPIISHFLLLSIFFIANYEIKVMQITFFHFLGPPKRIVCYLFNS